MANANTPFGLRPVADLTGRPKTGGVRLFSTAAGDATAFGRGDLVKITGASQTISGRVYSDVAIAASGDVFVGVCVGVEPTLGSGGVGRDATTYRAASTQRLVWVDTDPNTLYECQEIGTGTPFTANDIGLNCNVVVGSVSTATGRSGTMLDNTTEATTNTLDVKIVGLAPREDNEVGQYAKYLVQINRHQYANQVAGT